MSASDPNTVRGQTYLELPTNTQLEEGATKLEDETMCLENMLNTCDSNIAILSIFKQSEVEIVRTWSSFVVGIDRHTSHW